MTSKIWRMRYGWMALAIILLLVNYKRSSASNMVVKQMETTIEVNMNDKTAGCGNVEPEIEISCQNNETEGDEL